MFWIIINLILVVITCIVDENMLLIDDIEYNLLVPREEKQLEEMVKEHYNDG